MTNVSTISHITQGVVAAIIADPDSLSDVVVKHVPGIMYKLLINETEDYEIWCNVFEDATETYVHDHKSNFYSTMLHGGYDYKIWSTDNNDGYHYEFTRESGNVVSKATCKQGKLSVAETGRHFPGNLVYVPNTEFHTVEPLSGQSACVTLVVREKASKHEPTRILSQVDVVDSDSKDVKSTTVPRHVIDRVTAACLNFQGL